MTCNVTLLQVQIAFITQTHRQQCNSSPNR